MEQDVVNNNKNYASVMVPKMSGSKLKDLTWSLDVQDSKYAREKSENVRNIK